jgi:hypothetical protein
LRWAPSSSLHGAQARGRSSGGILGLGQRFQHEIERVRELALGQLGALGLREERVEDLVAGARQGHELGALDQR